MTKAQMFAEAHKQAKLDCRAFRDQSYSRAFGNALRGFHAVAAGYSGSFVR